MGEKPIEVPANLDDTYRDVFHDSRSTSQNVVQGHFSRFQHNKVFIMRFRPGGEVFTGKRSHRRDRILFRKRRIVQPGRDSPCQEGRSSAALGAHTDNSYTGRRERKGAQLSTVTEPPNLVATKNNDMTVQAQLRRPRCLMTGCLTIVGLLSTCLVMTAATAQDRAPDYAAVVAAPDRTEADVQTDKRRDPVKLLAFTGAHPGIKVLDMGAGGGYSTELMARAVAERRRLGQNPADIGERAKSRFEARLKTPGGKEHHRSGAAVRRSTAADVRDLDVITFFSSTTTPSHDVDRAA